tara:strand:+ start:882 stop:1850 length:969 start_codon:yes stop_codon:yes gene_type:complete
MKVLVTGSSGFIGFHLCLKLIKNKKNKIYGIDNLNDYYDVNIKINRTKILKNFKNFKFYKLDLYNRKKVQNFFKNKKFDLVIHLAAQAGVQYSLINPDAYINSNLIGFYNLLEEIKKNKIKKFMFASSSSVYGKNKKYPFSEDHKTDNQISLYGATKKSNEILAHYYSVAYGITILGLRFFTVYGPYGRPDMAMYKFTKNILKNKFIYLNNFGKHSRDFTYIDDCINSIYMLIGKVQNKNKKFNILNIAGGKTVKLKYLIGTLEKNLKKKAIIKYRKLQFGDVVSTVSNTIKLKKNIKKIPSTSIEKGVKNYCDWFRKYYKI